MNIEELVETSDKLCKGLQEAANAEFSVYADISLYLERMSWEMYRLRNNLKEIENLVGL